MKNQKECNNKGSSPEAMIYTAHRRLRNFCSTYNLTQADEMLCRVFTVLLGGNYSKQSNGSRQKLLDYFEALEEVLPAIFELHDTLQKTENQEGEEDIYQAEVSSQNIYASFKRHPE